MVETWLSSIHFEEYVGNFLSAGYDLPTISRMTPEDLIAIGITNPLHRKQIKHEISGLNVPDGIPTTIPESFFEWLYLLRLEEYFDLLKKQGYESVDKVAELTWEDFEDIGIKKLGHQKRLSLAIKRYKLFVRGGSGTSDTPGTTNSHYSSTSTVSNGVGGPSVNGSFPELMVMHHHHPGRPASQMGVTTCSVPSFRPIVINGDNNLADFVGTATLPGHERAAIVGKAVSFLPKSPNGNTVNGKPVAMIAAKTRGSCGSVDNVGGTGNGVEGGQLQDFVSELKKQHQLQQNGYTQSHHHHHFVGGSQIFPSVSTSSLISSGSVTSYDAVSEYGVMMPPRHLNYSQQLSSYDSSSSIYATIKRNRKKPPPPPIRTNSMKSSSSATSINVPSPSPSTGSTNGAPGLSSCTFTSSVHTTPMTGGSQVHPPSMHQHQYQQEDQIYSTSEQLATIDPYLNYHDLPRNDVYGRVGQQNQSRISIQGSSNVAAAPTQVGCRMQPPTSLLLHHQRSSLVDDFQDQAFATCVKSLTSRFSQMSTSAEDDSPQGVKFFNPPKSSSLEVLPPPPPTLLPPPPLPTRVESIQSTPHPSSLGGSEEFAEFPPPPTPLRRSMEELPNDDNVMEGLKRMNNGSGNHINNNQIHPNNIRQRNHHQHRFNLSNMNSPDDKSISPCRSQSSSSNESLPFANDNVGTIRQSVSSHSSSAFSTTSSTNIVVKVHQQQNCLNDVNSLSTFKPNPDSPKKEQNTETIESLAATLMSMKGQGSTSPSSPASSCSSNDSTATSSSSNYSSSKSLGMSSSSPTSSKIQQSRNIGSSPQGVRSNHHQHPNHPQAGGEGNVVIDDIESMLANLSSQLDAMLEQEIAPPSRPIEILSFR